ncbi:hypothetical protein TNCT_65961 [Trichonephila clavata]|uniref:Uncharacterized protein n=1 Tax=Trichonephila clavata TaxID=2740835 RepID=A0A8X6G1C7_TRICU|nr:hypothetical protein TNCT_65961 [Trichonephila clavata]
MGFRATWKEDLQATTAEMIFGIPIRLPGEYLCRSKRSADPVTFVGRPRKSMQPLSLPTSRSTYNLREKGFGNMQPCLSAYRLPQKGSATSIRNSI